MAVTTGNPPPRDIDFLPASYREAGVQRKHATLRVVVVAAFVALIVFAAIYQRYLRSQADQQLADLLPRYDQAKQEMVRMGQLQQQLQSADKQAELCTYLKHPWPRSQILAMVAEPLPEEIELKEISIAREPLPASEQPSQAATAKPSEAALAKLEPTQRDLLVMRDRCDRTQTVLQCSGITEDLLALHRYLELLGRSPLLAKVDVKSIDRVADDSSGRIHFTVRVIVLPGYSQPHGPRPAAEAVTASIPHAEN